MLEVSPFLITKNSITNKQFKEFLKHLGKNSGIWKIDETRKHHRNEYYLRHWDDINYFELNYHAIDDEPIVNVSWMAASAFAAFYGCTLPTVAQILLARHRKCIEQISVKDHRHAGEWCLDFWDDDIKDGKLSQRNPDPFFPAQKFTELNGRQDNYNGLENSTTQRVISRFTTNDNENSGLNDLLGKDEPFDVSSQPDMNVNYDVGFRVVKVLANF